MSRWSRWLCAALAALLLGLALYWVPSACASVEAQAPRLGALDAALRAHALHARRLTNRRLLTLIDYDLPFTTPRLWVIDLGRERAVLHHSRVSHAWSSGALFATRFSNVPGSHLSSLGSYATAARTYEGRFGHSLRVHGLDRGVNDKAHVRDIVFHPAGIASHSLGCFMLPDAFNGAILDTIVGGSFVYVHRSPEGG